ncbi:MAG: glycosyltransferase family 4 protein [Firmicutes bacterium]|nr:glycosyltransferase family 4 protein [Bacillota bacterium]
MEKITVNMLSMADKVDGQGVGSAYLEQVELVKSSPKFNILINSKEKADIVHIHTIEPQNYIRLKDNKGIKVAYCHFLPETLDGSIKLPKPVFNIFKKYVVNFYKNTDYLVVVNPIFIDDLVKHGIEREKIKYIPNYVSKDQFFKKSKNEIKNIRKKLGIAEDKFVVLGVGQVQTRKGVLDFVEVAKKLPDVEFVWCGGFSFGAITDGFDELKKIYECPPKNVRFLGIIPREEMNDMYNMADVLFMPSYNELFPMAILEAVNSEKPLLLRNLDLYHNILFDKYVSGKNNRDFVREIKNLRDDKILYKSECNHSKEINQFYSKENVLKIWEDFYAEIVEKSKDIVES